jgi:hypothetical protein
MDVFRRKIIRMKTKTTIHKFSLAVKLKNCQNNFLPFKEARVFVRKLKLKNYKEWREYCISGQKPKNIPSTPHMVYKNKGWKNVYNWLGTPQKMHVGKDFIPFEDAREFAKSLKLKSCREWKKYAKSGRRPKNIPSNPYAIYKDKGWVGWGDWTGENNLSNIEINENLLPFKEARAFARKLKLKSQKEWFAYFNKHERPFNIPISPHQSYKNKGWISWGDWLGISHLQIFHNRTKKS